MDNDLDAVDDADDDGGADLVFMAVCRPTHGSTILFHSLQSHREGVLGGWGEGAGGTRTVLQQRDSYRDSFSSALTCLHLQTLQLVVCSIDCLEQASPCA